MFSRRKKQRTRKRKIITRVILGGFALLLLGFIYYYYTTGGIVFSVYPDKVPFSLILKAKGSAATHQFNSRSLLSLRQKPGTYYYSIVAPGYVNSFGTVSIHNGKQDAVKVTLKKQPSVRELAGPSSAKFPVLLPGAQEALCIAGDSLVKVNLTDGRSSALFPLPLVTNCWWASSGATAVVTVTNDAELAASAPGALYDPAAGPVSTWLVSPSSGVLDQLAPGIS